jgi:uncharacterized protein (DUF1697 family)
MARYAAFLRGMNLGNRRITNDELRTHVTALGFAQVASFRASGNVIVETARTEPAERVARRIESGLAKALGYDVPVFARTAAELREIAAHEPFDAELVAASAGRLQVVLLGAAPAAPARRAVLALATDDDRLDLRERELYWLPSGGLLESALDQKALAAALGATTTRTKGTIDLIAARHFAD